MAFNDETKKNSSLMKNVSLLADLVGWSGMNDDIAGYQWLSSYDVLVESEASDREGMFYRLPVHSGMGTQQKPLVLTEMSHRTREYRDLVGKRVAGRISPDGRWLLYIGTKPLKKGNGRKWSDGTEVLQQYYWCAVAVDGSRDVAWAIKIYPFNEPVYQTRPWVKLSNATWLPDSSGILETIADWDRDHRTGFITGQVRLLDSPGIVHELPRVSLGKLPDTDYAVPGVYPVQSIDTKTGKNITLCRRPQTHDVLLYQWDWSWQSHTKPSVRTTKITLPTGYDLFAESLSHKGDRIAWALMDRAHHSVVSTGTPLSPSQRAGEIGLWVSRIGSGQSTSLQKVGQLPIPTGREAWCYQRFGLGDWLPDGKHISFQFGRRLYSLPVP